MMSPLKTPLGKLNHILTISPFQSETHVSIPDEVIKKPSSACSYQRFPIVAYDQTVWDFAFDGSSTIQFTVQHLDSEVED